MKAWYKKLNPYIQALFPIIIIFIFILLPLFIYSSNQYSKYLLNIEKSKVELEVARFGSSIDKAMNNRILLLNGLEGFVEVNKDLILDEDFILFAKGLTSAVDGVRNVIIAPNGINTFVYPIEGNESSIGHDQVNDERPEVRESVAQAIQTKELIVSGPYELRQGGIGIIFKKAIFRDGEFWGMISEVLDVEPIFEISGIKNYESTLKIAIGSKSNVIVGDVDVFDKNPVIYNIQLPQGQLEVAVIPIEGWAKSIQSKKNTFLYYMIFSSILVLLLIYSVYYTKNKLKYIVIKKTDQIEKTNLQLRTLIDGLWDWNILNNEFIFSEQYEEMLGYDVGSLPKILSTFYGLLHPDDAAFVKKDIQKYFDKKGEEFYEKSFRLRTKDGSWKWILSRGKAKFDSNGHPLRFVGFCTDISEQRDYQDKLEFIAKHDSLTKLPNRFSLTKLLTHSMHIAKSNNKQLALLYIDLDGFKEINDTLGHSAGDEVLSIISSRLKKIIRTNDVVSRIGGDEFVIVITNLNEKNEIIIIVQKCLKEILKEIKYGDNIICVSASIGISFYPQYNEIGNEVLIRQADQAMYEAKTFGKNQYKIFNVEASKELKKSISFTSRVYQAIEENEFVLNYQPKVNMRNNKVIGVEALLRWNHPDKGFLYPDSFLPLIEGQSDLKIELGKWVLQSAFSQLQEWHKLGCNISMNINVSACEIQKEDFSSFIKKLFYDFPLIKPNKIEIEILETASFYNFDIASKTLQECQKLGVSVAIDDFGTGYAAMNYLKKLPINTIKIDKSFIIDLLYKSSSLSIVEGSVGLAKAFNTNIVAEGIESEEHGIILLQFGCELAQGYVIAKAMPAQNIITWIDSYKGFASWNNVKSISENERSVLYARINHLSWFYDIEKFIENTTTYLPQLKESKCYLGEWLKNDGFKEYGNNPIFIDLKVQHEKMHNYVQSILILDIKDKTKEISILKNYSEKILKKLSQLANETNII